MSEQSSSSSESSGGSGSGKGPIDPYAFKKFRKALRQDTAHVVKKSVVEGSKGGAIVALGVAAAAFNMKPTGKPQPTHEFTDMFEYIVAAPVLLLLRGLGGVAIDGDVAKAKKNGAFPILGWV